jgi:hypothetical protein
MSHLHTSLFCCLPLVQDFAIFRDNKYNAARRLEVDTPQAPGTGPLGPAFMPDRQFARITHAKPMILCTKFA